MNGENSTGDGWVSVSPEPFYEKHDGLDSEFTIINGVYQPIISMTVRAGCHPAFVPCRWCTSSWYMINPTCHYAVVFYVAAIKQSF